MSHTSLTHFLCGSLLAILLLSTSAMTQIFAMTQISADATELNQPEQILELCMQVNNQFSILNDNIKAIKPGDGTVSPKMIGGMCFIPLRFIADCTDTYLYYDSDINSVIISSPTSTVINCTSGEIVLNELKLPCLALNINHSLYIPIDYIHDIFGVSAYFRDNVVFITSYEEIDTDRTFSAYTPVISTIADVYNKSVSDLYLNGVPVRRACTIYGKTFIPISDLRYYGYLYSSRVFQQADLRISTPYYSEDFRISINSDVEDCVLIKDVSYVKSYIGTLQDSLPANIEGTETEIYKLNDLEYLVSLNTLQLHPSNIDLSSLTYYEDTVGSAYLANTTKTTNTTNTTVSDYALLKTAHDYMCMTMYYSDTYRFNAPLPTLFNSTGQCYDFSSAFKEFCDRAWIPCSIVLGTHDGNAHAWNDVFYDSTWRHTDTTYDIVLTSSSTSGYSKPSTSYFLLKSQPKSYKRYVY